MTGNVVVSDLMYVLQSKRGKYVPYGKLDRIRQSVMLQTKCRKNQGRYYLVQQYTRKKADVWSPNKNICSEM
jgi:hypothetical protein